MRLAGKVIAITGGGAGIGRACALAYAREGAAVAVTDVDGTAASSVAQEIHAAGGRAYAGLLDVTRAGSIQPAIEAIERAIGPIEIWHNNAGISSMDRFVDLAEADWDRNLDVNAKGTFLCSQAFARYLIGSGRKGKIINTASMAGKRGNAPYLAHYVASKFAVVGLTQAMAGELAPHGILVNSICPGYVRTTMQAREVAWEAALRQIGEAEVRQMYADDTPLGRLQEAEDVAGVAVFLASSDSDFITGQSINVNGGAFMD